MEKIPKPGEFYRHFKNKMYQIIAVAIHSETGEKLVVYQALYGDFAVYARPLAMFMEAVDKEKYPEAVQKDRFQQVFPGREKEGAFFKKEEEVPPSERQLKIPQPPEEETERLNPLLMKFLDADTCGEQLAVLQMMKGKVGQMEVDNLYVSLDMKPCEGTVEEQLDDLKRFLNMQQRFDASRLRRS